MEVTATPSCSASRRMVKASTPATSIIRAAVSRTTSALTGGRVWGVPPPLRGGVNRITPGDSVRLGELQVPLEVAVHVDHAPLLVGQHDVSEPGLVQPALKARQYRDVLCEYQTGVSFGRRHAHVGGLVSW